MKPVYCSTCGQKLLPSTPSFCPKCQRSVYVNPSPVAVSVTPVVDDHGNIVGCVGVQRSAKTGLGAQGWAFPGGYVELGEHPKQAALRELKEETSLIPVTNDTRVLDAAISANGEVVLVFIETSPVSLKDVQEAVVSDECEQVAVLNGSSHLTFSTHQEVLTQWLCQHGLLAPPPAQSRWPKNL